MRHDDHVRFRARGQRGERAALPGRQHVGHGGGPLGQVRVAAAPQPVDAAPPAQRRPVAALGEDKEGAAGLQARREPPDLFRPLAPESGPLAAGAAASFPARAQEGVRHPVTDDVQARVQLQSGLHDDPGPTAAHAEQVVDEQQRVAGAGVPGQHDQRPVAGHPGRHPARPGHRHPQAAGALGGPVHDVEERLHHRVVPSLVRLRVQPAAEAARDPQPQQRRHRRHLAERPGQREVRHPQQPRPGSPARAAAPEQVEGHGQDRHRRRQPGQRDRDHDGQRHHQQAADQARGHYPAARASSAR